MSSLHRGSRGHAHTLSTSVSLDAFLVNSTFMFKMSFPNLLFFPEYLFYAWRKEQAAASFNERLYSMALNEIRHSWFQNH